LKPTLLHYYLTYRCNSRCSFCSIWRDNPKIDASASDVIENLKSARKAGCSFVDFTGGEPLLHDDLPIFLKEAKNSGYITSVTTNCLLFPERAKSLNGLIDLLHFSLDGDSAEIHDKIRGVPSFQTVLKSIDIAIENHLYPDLLFTYTDENIHHFEGVYKLALEKKLMLILDPVFDPDGSDPVSKPTHQLAISYGRRKGVYLNCAHLTLRKRGGNHTIRPVCKAVDSAIVILPDNTLALPCFHHISKKIPINDNLSSILKSLEHSEAAEIQGRENFCENCHINCYFDPSYLRFPNRLFFESLLSKFKYSYTKYLIYGRPLPSILLKRL
jgi:MoaA/NifB/PqqE/SkfB family radical SAM enzyme